MNLQKHILRVNKKPVKIIVPLITKESVNIYITGYDPSSPNTEYFSRKIIVNGTDKVEFNCPQSPRKLKVIIWSDEKKKFTVPKIDIIPLSRTLNFTEDQKPDILFIERFSRIAGRLSPRRTYVFKGAKYKIELLPVILRDNGLEHPTPARIHTELPLIQVSKKHFIKMTIPQRVAILLHEYSHNFVNYNQDDEMEADNNMIGMYESLGYPRLEAVYAFANVMNDTDVNYSRVDNIINSI